MFRSHSILILPAVAAADERGAVEAHVDAAAGVWPAVPAAHLPARMTEVDARSIIGHGGTVFLYLSVGVSTQQYLVVVENAVGETLSEITTATRAEALDAYRHPFARPDVPDIFAAARS
jgi:hypothetical protein